MGTKSVNCLTRSLHHWNKYGGTIIYDSSHAKVIDSERYYHDHVEMYSSLDIKDFGINYFLSAHKEFLNDEEIEILTKYLES